MSTLTGTPSCPWPPCRATPVSATSPARRRGQAQARVAAGLVVAAGRGPRQGPRPPMAERLVALDGSTVFVSDERGDVEPVEAMGFFHDDVRHLSTWRLLVDGSPIRLLSAQNPDYYSASVFGTLAQAA
jgi:hypothetical protein